MPRLAGRDRHSPKMIRYSLLPLLSLAAACAMSDVDAPSLAKRQVENLDFDTPVAVVAAEPITALPPSLSASVEEARAKSAAAHEKFQTDLPAVQRRVAAADGAARESEAWIAAQIALSSLEVVRSASVDALADLDRLYIAQRDQEISENRSGGGALIAQTRELVEAEVASQSDAIDRLRDGLR